MSQFLTEEQELLRSSVRQFTHKEVEPLAIKIDREEHTPSELIKGIADLGLFGLFIPEQYGGTGADATSTCVALEEIAKASPSLAGLLSVQIILCPGTINAIGNEEQKSRILPKSASGQRLIAYSQTEPCGASDITRHQTKLTWDGNAWRLNGAKLFCTQGEAQTYIVMCRTSRDGAEGYGCVIVEREAEGFEVAPYEDKLGWRGTNTGAISFNNVLITRENILGDLLTGRADHVDVNEVSFLGHAATSLGCIEGLFDKTLAYVKERDLYGSPMYRLQPVAYWLVDVHTKIEAMRALLYTSTRLHDEGRRDQFMGSVCKVYICDTAFQCTSTLMQLWGGTGIMNNAGINRYFRDARTNMIAEGSSEKHTTMLAEKLFGFNLRGTLK